MAKGSDNKGKVIYYLSLVGFFAIFSSTISKNPVLPLYTQALGASSVVIGLIAAISPLAGVLFSFPVGMLSDKIGRKRLLLASALIFVSAPLLYVFIDSAVWLIPIRFFHGMATAILGPVASSVIVSIYHKDKGEKLGLYSSSTLIGRTIAPLLGGFLLSYFAVYGGLGSYRMVYVAAFFLALPVLVLVMLMRNDEGKGAVKSISLHDFRESLSYLYSEKRILSTAVVEMATYFAFGALETYLPVFLSANGVPAYLIGIVFSVQILSIALSKPLFGKIADRVDKRKQILAGIIVLGASIGLVGMSHDIYIITAIGIVFGFGLSFSTVATSAYVADVSDKNKLGSSLGALSSIMDIGHSSGPFITGIVVSAFSYSIGFTASTAVCLASAAVFVAFNAQSAKSRIPETKRKPG
jgi:MFS family permease